jgi:hypothetical protein
MGPWWLLDQSGQYELEIAPSVPKFAKQVVTRQPKQGDEPGRISPLLFS